MSALKQLMDRLARDLQARAVRRLQDYLVGKLSRKQRVQIERRLIDGEDFFQELLAAEDMLIQDFIRGLLPSDLASGVSELGRTSGAWKQKVDFARATRALIGRKAKQSSSAPTDTELMGALYDD